MRSIRVRCGVSRRLCLGITGLGGLWLGGALCTTASAGPPASEMVRIERLLVMIGSRQDMRMVRNGRDYDADTAVTFLRRKLESMGDDVKTAEEFIDRIATRSSMSGQLYALRLPDGREIPAGAFLRSELIRLDKAASR